MTAVAVAALVLGGVAARTDRTPVPEASALVVDIEAGEVVPVVPAPDVDPAPGFTFDPESDVLMTLGLDGAFGTNVNYFGSAVNTPLPGFPIPEPRWTSRPR